MIEILIIALVIGFILDMIVGDPYWLPHPICLIGNFISKGEKAVRKIFPKSQKGEFLGGMSLSILTVVLAFVVPFFIIWCGYLIDKRLVLILNAIMSYQILAAKCLKTESMKVYEKLNEKDIDGARYALSMIVGRETKNLNEEQIAKAAVETVAENTSDGVIAPMFYFIIGGAPLAFAYKAINTLDSMIGYKNEKYLFFGRFAAKLDDVANFIPARIGAMLLIIGSFVLRYDYKNSGKIYLRDRKNHASPNSAQLESACAGALDIQLAGDAVYFGKVYKKPFIGDKIKETEAIDIRRANNLMYTASIAMVILLVVIVEIGVYLI